MCSSKEIGKISLISRPIERKFKLALPTATTARKTAATCAARHLGTRENSLISAQMSHNISIHNAYYAAVRGRREAAEAAMVLEDLRHAR